MNKRPCVHKGGMTKDCELCRKLLARHFCAVLDKTSEKVSDVLAEVVDHESKSGHVCFLAACKCEEAVL